MASYKTKAIVINRLNLGESDRILTLFSPELGKIKAICRGGRRTKSKFGGHTELFSLTDFVVTAGKNLDIITDAALDESYLTEKPDMDKVKTAYFFAEIVNKLLPERSPYLEIYDLLLYSYRHLDVSDTKMLQLIFIAKILKTLGVYPELSNCVKCEQKPEASEIYFSSSANGIVDKNCSKRLEDAHKVDKDTIKLWRFVADKPLEEVLQIKAKPETVDLASRLAGNYIHCATQIDVKSLRVLS